MNGCESTINIVGEPWINPLADVDLDKISWTAFDGKSFTSLKSGDIRAATERFEVS